METRGRKSRENCNNPGERSWRPELRQWPWGKKEKKNVRVVRSRFQID